MASLTTTSIQLSGLSILTIAVLALSFSNPVMAQSGSEAVSDSGVKKLGQLEEKFFQHSYPKDEMQSRLERLEKLVFGGPKSGATPERLSALFQAVPVVETSSNRNDSDSGKRATNSEAANKEEKVKSTKASAINDDTSDYPAVTAMERKALGKDFIGDPIGQRLGRLEAKEFGRPSTSTDLSERVDRLKQRVGIDVARIAPNGTDWADDDEEDAMPMPTSVDPIAKAGEDGKSFSGRDLRSDMHKAFGGMSGAKSYSSPSASGAYGMGNYGTSSGSSGAYGFGSNSGMSGGGSSASFGLSDRQAADIPPMAPLRTKSRVPADPQMASMDLPSQVTALEKEILGKSHNSDPLLTRLNRLETAVFPQQKPASNQSVSDRVQHLLAVVPVSEKHSNKKSKHADDDLDLSASNSQGQQSRGLGKIINSLSSLMGGSSVGGYPVRSGSYVTDPQTGMLIDQYTGNMIDPNTGAVMGARTMPAPIYGSSYGSGLGNYGGFGSFNNGFSPFGSPYSGYGMGSGMGSGLRFGFGGGRMGGF